MRIQSLFLGLCLFAGATLAAAGEYQQTRDGKTTVWNASPKTGETASWSGSRDKEGYATGFGTITWYTAQGSVNSEYYGNMVNGKLEGPVNMHSGTRTAHAYFADGGRVTAWARGRAPSQMNVPQELVAKRRKAESEPPKPRAERAEVKKTTTEKAAATSEQVRPIEQPAKPAVAETKPKPTPEQRESVEPPALETPPPVSRSTPEPIAETTATIPTPEPTQSTSSIMEPPKVAESQPESSTGFANETPAAPTPESTVEQKPETTEQSTSTPEEPRKSSVSDLTGPPSSLRESTSEAPKSETTSRAKSAGTRGVASLSEDDAIGVADAEARSKGYDLAQYQRPKADYSAVKDKWSLFYTLKDPKTAGGDLQPFSVTVDDKSRKVEIRRNY